MGCRIAGSVFVSFMRQFVKSWRGGDRHNYCITLLHWCDDFFITAPTSPRLLQDLCVVIGSLTDAHIPIGYPKCFLGRLVDKPGAVTSIFGVDYPGEYQGHQVVEFLGAIIDLKKGRFFAKPSRVRKCLQLVRQVRDNIRAAEDYRFITLARICGRIVSMRFGLLPSRLMTRAMFRVMKCKTKEDYMQVVAECPLVTSEIMFWSRNLMTFWRLGGPIFPDARPYTLRLRVDAGPEGWGGDCLKGRITQGAQAVLFNVDETHAFNMSDAWHRNDSEADQCLRELRGAQHPPAPPTPHHTLRLPLSTERVGFARW